MVRIEEQQLIKYLAIFAALSACTIRIAMAVGQIAAGVAVLLGIILWRKGRMAVSEGAAGYIKAYGVFVLLTLPSIVFSDNPVASVNSFFNLWIWRYALFLVIVFFIHRREYLVNMLIAYLTASSVEFLFTLVELLKNMRPDGRGMGFGGQSMVLTLGGILCMLLPIALVILMDAGFEKRLKKAASFALISILVGQLCNKSRGAWLTDLILVPVATFRYVKQNKRYLAVVLAVFLGIAGFMASNPGYVQRVQSIANTTTDRSNVDRFWVWRSAADMVRDHPVTGVGSGRFRETYLKKYIYEQESQKLSHAHNNFFHVTAEYGLVGLAGLLYFIGYYVYNSLRNYRKNKNPYDILVFTTIFGYLCLFGQIDYSLGSSTGIRVMWFLLAILLQLKETDRNRDW